MCMCAILPYWKHNPMKVVIKQICSANLKKKIPQQAIVYQSNE